MRTETITRDIYEPGDILDIRKTNGPMQYIGFVLVLDVSPDNTEYLILTDKNRSYPVEARLLDGAHHMKKIDLSEWSAFVKKAEMENHNDGGD